MLTPAPAGEESWPGAAGRELERPWLEGVVSKSLVLSHDANFLPGAGRAGTEGREVKGDIQAESTERLPRPVIQSNLVTGATWTPCGSVRGVCLDSSRTQGGGGHRNNGSQSQVQACSMGARILGSVWNSSRKLDH